VRGQHHHEVMNQVNPISIQHNSLIPKQLYNLLRASSIPAAATPATSQSPSTRVAAVRPLPNQNRHLVLTTGTPQWSTSTTPLIPPSVEQLLGAQYLETVQR
jgi:hypothetical protein